MPWQLGAVCWMSARSLAAMRGNRDQTHRVRVQLGFMERAGPRNRAGATVRPGSPTAAGGAVVHADRVQAATGMRAAGMPQRHMVLVRRAGTPLQPFVGEAVARVAGVQRVGHRAGSGLTVGAAG